MTSPRTPGRKAHNWYCLADDEHVVGGHSVAHKETGRIHYTFPVPDIPETFYLQDVIWQNQTGQPIVLYTASYTVPPPPVSDDGQADYIWHGLVSSDKSGVLQPVLQWGVSAAGGGPFWSITNWWVTGTATFHPPIQVAVGTQLQAEISCTSNGDGTFNYLSRFIGYPAIDLTLTDSPELPYAYVTLEAYGRGGVGFSLAQCSDLPQTDRTKVTGIGIAVGSPTNWVNPAWSVEDHYHACGEKIVVVSSTSPNGEVDIYFGQSPSTTPTPTPTPVPAPTSAAVNYQVQYKRVIDWNWTQSDVFNSAAATVLMTVPKLAENTSYHFRVLAEDSRYSQPVAMATTTTATTTQAPDGTFISRDDQSFKDAAGNVWGLTSQGTNQPFVVTINGAPDTTAQNVIMLAMVSNTIHFQNKSYLWFAKQTPSETWQAIGDPRSGVPTVLSLPGNLQTAAASPVAITYHGGQVLDNCNLTLVYWGSAWNAVLQKPSRYDISNAVNQMITSNYFSGMTEYGIQDPPIVVNDLVTSRVPVSAPTPAPTPTPSPTPTPTPTPTPAGG